MKRRFAALLKRHPLLKSTAAAILRVSTRTYMRNAPWMFGKHQAYDLYVQYLGGRLGHRAKVRTPFGDIMELETGDFLPYTIYLTGYWEPIITRYIRRHLKPGDTFIDCGANVGYFSLIASRIVGRHGNVFSIEASEQIFRSMLANLELNRCANVTPIHAAAAGEEGELSIFLHESIRGHSTTVRSLAEKEGMAFETKIRANTLEKLVGPSNLRNARIIKLDAEGAEPTILAPLFDSLDRFSSHTEWLIELSPNFYAGGQDDVDTILGAFRDAGYTAYHMPNSYDTGFIVSPPRNPALVPLQLSPRDQCDVLMSRRSEVQF
jgi:FkbM family methyltransferase